MRQNLSKCKIINLGKKKNKTQYTMQSYGDDTNAMQIESTESERDLGIQLSSNLKYYDQVSKASSKANKMLGLLKRTFITRNKHIWKKLYMTYVRPQLESLPQKGYTSIRNSSAKGHQDLSRNKKSQLRTQNNRTQSYNIPAKTNTRRPHTKV